MILTELIRSRDAIDTAIAYVRGDTALIPAGHVRAKTIRAGEGRTVAILSSLRNSGGFMGQREFEDTCLRNCRTLVGAGGFIARGSITREMMENGDIVYKLTDKGRETVERWEARYGGNWTGTLEHSDVLGDAGINDHQKVRLLT